MGDDNINRRSLETIAINWFRHAKDAQKRAKITSTFENKYDEISQDDGELEAEDEANNYPVNDISLNTNDAEDNFEEYYPSADDNEDDLNISFSGEGAR